MRRRSFIKSIISAISIAIFGQNATAIEEKSQKQQFIDYITQMLEQNYNPETERFELLSLYESRVNIEVDMWDKESGCTNVNIEIYGKDGTRPCSCLLRANNYHRKNWGERNDNIDYKYNEEMRLWEVEVGHTKIDNCVPK
jgi:hypothetical protein